MDNSTLGLHIRGLLGTETPDGLYSTLNSTFLQKTLKHMFKTRFNSQTLTFIRKCYPDWAVCSWKFKSPLKNQWNDKQNRIFAVCTYIKEQEKWTCRDDFYKLNINILQKHLGSGITDYYAGRVYDILIDVLPPSFIEKTDEPIRHAMLLMPPAKIENRHAIDNWYPWKIGDQRDCEETVGGRKRCRATPKGLWSEPSNRKWYVEWLCKEKGYAIPDDLNRLNRYDFEEHYGKGMLVKCYNTCILTCLHDIFPEYIESHLQWFMFKRKPSNSCLNKLDFPRAMKYICEKEGWVRPEHFYQLRRKDFDEKKWDF